MTRARTMLRGLVWVVCCYHLAVGLLFNMPLPWVEWTAEHAFSVTRMPGLGALPIARMLGAFMAAFGLMMGLVALDPQRFRPVLTVGVALVAVRCVQRAATAQQLEALLGISTASNLATLAVLVTIAVALLAYRLVLEREQLQE